MTNFQAATSAPARTTRGAFCCRLRMIVIVAVVLVLAVAHRPLLRNVAGLLIVDESPAGASWIVLFDGDRMSEYVAERRRDAADTRVLLIERALERTQALGARPSWVEERRSSLVARAVPASAIDVLPASTRDDWDRARILRAWLIEHSKANVVVVCDRFRSRRVRIILDRVLGTEAGRAFIVALPDRGYDENNWWRNKYGQLGVFEGFTRLAYVALAGKGDGPGPTWDPDAYERALP